MLKSLTERPTVNFPKEISSVNSVEDQISKHCSPTFVTGDLLSKHQLTHPLIPDITHPLSPPITNTDTSTHHPTTSIDNDTPVSDEACSKSLNMNQSPSHLMPPPVIPSRRY
ncbi:hypothetical protein HAX54_013940, partial [Datura stramonium]|nr:hypothetical protein [Datura stramonium]